MKILTSIMRFGACLSLCVSISAAVQAATAPLADISEHPKRGAPATAVSINQSTLSAQIQANVKSIAVGVSQAVKQGDTLLMLDCTDYELALQMARAGVTIAEARLSLATSQQQRSNQLLEKQLTSQENADTTVVDAVARLGELEQAKISLRQAQINVGRCAIKAPFDGIISQRVISEGQLASVGTPLIALIDTQRIELSAQVKPEEALQLQKVSELVFDAGERYPVALLRLGGTINSETRDQEVRLAFKGARPPAGSAGKLVWRDPRAYIPTRFIVQRDGQLGLFRALDGKAQFYPLPEAVPGRAAPVMLPDNSLIITDNLGLLQHGDELPQP